MIEKGVMIMKDGKAWGVTYSDGHCTCHGWVEPENGKIHDPDYCRKPHNDSSFNDSSDMTSLRTTAKVVRVERETIVRVLE